MKKTVLIATVTLAVLTAATGCNRNANKTTEEVDSLVLVKTLPATLELIDQTYEFTSNIQPFKENNISPSLAVRIDRINVDVGANVRRGQLLVRMDATQYNTAAATLANIEADYQRMKAVFESGGISKQQLDQYEVQYTVQKETVGNLIDNIELRSPIDGVVTERNYDPGDLYTGVPILKVMQIDNVKVTVDISEQYFPMVKNGMPAEISVDMFPDRTFDGKVSLIYPAIDPATRTFTIEITIPNKDRALRPGMFSRTTLNFGQSEGVMVEDLAVQKQIGSNEKYLFVYRDGVAERRLVETGRQVGNKINILSGVSEGEQVVVAGISRLVNGTAVKVENN